MVCWPLNENDSSALKENASNTFCAQRVACVREHNWIISFDSYRFVCRITCNNNLNYGYCFTYVFYAHIWHVHHTNARMNAYTYIFKRLKFVKSSCIKMYTRIWKFVKKFVDNSHITYPADLKLGSSRCTSRCTYGITSASIHRIWCFPPHSIHGNMAYTWAGLYTCSVWKM